MTNQTNEKQYFTINEALQDILYTLENGYDGYLCELHHEVFNTDYYIIGTYEAKQALTQYGVFEAIGEIQEYETDHFGEIFTKLENPENVANMLYYLTGEKAMEMIQESNDLLSDSWNDSVNDEIGNSLIETIKELLANY